MLWPNLVIKSYLKNFFLFLGTGLTKKAVAPHTVDQSSVMQIQEDGRKVGKMNNKKGTLPF